MRAERKATTKIQRRPEGAGIDANTDGGWTNVDMVYQVLSPGLKREGRRSGTGRACDSSSLFPEVKARHDIFSVLVFVGVEDLEVCQ